jgi:hypothetical protein
MSLFFTKTKVFLLRGNHELSYVNSQLETYGTGCFRYQCLIFSFFFFVFHYASLFSSGSQAFKQRGDDVYWAINRAFDCLPIAAIVDHELFCVHGFPLFIYFVIFI